MCGIVGIINGNLKPDSSNVDLMLSMRGKLLHRGKDHRGGCVANLQWGAAYLGMNRLAITDRNQITTPYFYEYLNLSLVFNGEIYNWQELRHELSNGTAWQTMCDAEVIARAWRKWGTRCLERFNGMFAFCIADIEKQEIFIARDRAGMKPFYYAVKDDNFYFASEIKALPIKLEENKHCDEYNTLEFDCLNETMFKGVKSLNAGNFIHAKDMKSLLQLESEPTTQWWHLSFAVNHNITYEEALEELTYLVRDAIILHAHKDIQTEVLLSGGLDSAIIQAVANKENLYTVTFDECDNMAESRLASDGFEPIPIKFSKEDLLRDLPLMVYHLDTPSTWTACCQWYLFKKIAENGNKVALSGEGADELFLGYSRYKILYWLDRCFQDSSLASYIPTIKYLIGSQSDILSRLIDRSDNNKHMLNAERLIVRCCDESHLLPHTMARVDFNTTMQVLLRMADRMSMAHTVECRCPFLDSRLLDFVPTLPDHFKINEFETKHILRDVARKLGVNDKIVNEKTKKGLFVPRNWFCDNEGVRGIWDRHVFRDLIYNTWKEVFEL